VALLTRRSNRIPGLTVSWVGWQAEEYIQLLVERGLVLLDDHQVLAVLRMAHSLKHAIALVQGSTLTGLAYALIVVLSILVIQSNNIGIRYRRDS